MLVKSTSITRRTRKRKKGIETQTMTKNHENRPKTRNSSHKFTPYAHFIQNRSTTRHKFEASNFPVNQAFSVDKTYQHLGLVLLVPLVGLAYQVPLMRLWLSIKPEGTYPHFEGGYVLCHATYLL